MADTILHSEPYGAMLLAPEVPCLIVAWYSFANSEQFRSLMDRGLELYAAEAQRTQPLGWLADTRGVSAIRVADQEWLEKDWSPRAYAAGIHHVSFVVPETVFGQMAVSNYSSKAVSNTTYAITPDQHRTLAEAKAWLHNELLSDS